jgi:hypothetical protein
LQAKKTPFMTFLDKESQEMLIITLFSQCLQYYTLDLQCFTNFRKWYILR